MSNNPNPPNFQLNTRRGFVLGIPIFLVLVASAVVVYLIAGALGWKGNGQIIAAMCAGPFLGFVVIALYFGIARPKIL
jgi:cation transporter-like permease